MTIQLVQNDTGPDITVTIYDVATNAPIDFSNASDVVKMHFAREDGTGSPVSITGTKPGGGGDGRALFAWSAGNLASVGDYEGEIEITFSDSTVQTVYDLLKFKVREDF